MSLPVSSAGLGLGAQEAVTRRQAAADVIRALVASGLETEITEIVGVWISQGLQQYAANKDKEDGWKAKDTAVYLLTAVATRGSTTQVTYLQFFLTNVILTSISSQLGVTSTNTLVDVVKFFSDHVFQDLQAPAGSVHPLLQVDAIRFLYTFRTQVGEFFGSGSWN